MFGLYLHIPFCPSKCSYCDFYSLGKKNAVPEEYVDALISEITKHLGCSSTPLHPDTVYFGGGTPSLLTPQQIARILSAANCVPNGEITLEVNPNTVSLDTLIGFRQAGINRLSVGVQTASDQSLKTLSRMHTAQQSADCLQNARKAGFTNISGDIMLALPNYSFAECDQTIKLLAENGCTHISSYILKIEQGTQFYLHRPENLPDDDACAEFYLYAVNEISKRGFSQYEISNFAQIGFESKHNLIYWNCNDYLGIGPSAHSCVANKRFYYKNSINSFLQSPTQILDGECTAEDYIMLQLRLNSGLSLEKLTKKYGVTLEKSKIDFLKKCQKYGLCTLDNDTIVLTPNGMIVQNSILAEIL